MKISTTVNACRVTLVPACTETIKVGAKNIVDCLFLVIASNDYYCHQADGIFDFNSFLFCIIRPNFLSVYAAWGDRELGSIAYRLHSIMPIDWVAVTGISSESFFRKITSHTVLTICTTSHPLLQPSWLSSTHHMHLCVHASVISRLWRCSHCRYEQQVIVW